MAEGMKGSALLSGQCPILFVPALTVAGCNWRYLLHGSRYVVDTRACACRQPHPGLGCARGQRGAAVTAAGGGGGGDVATPTRRCADSQGLPRCLLLNAGHATRREIVPAS